MTLNDIAPLDEDIRALIRRDREASPPPDAVRARILHKVRLTAALSSTLGTHDAPAHHADPGATLSTTPSPAPSSLLTASRPATGGLSSAGIASGMLKLPAAVALFLTGVAAGGIAWEALRPTEPQHAEPQNTKPRDAATKARRSLETTVPSVQRTVSVGSGTVPNEAQLNTAQPNEAQSNKAQSNKAPSLRPRMPTPAGAETSTSVSNTATNRRAPAKAPGPTSGHAHHRTATTREFQDDRLKAERAIIARAHSALLRGRPREALNILGEHQRQFASGLLVEERQALEIRALFARGRSEEAAARAAEFRSRYPTSLFGETLGPR